MRDRDAVNDASKSLPIKTRKRAGPGGERGASSASAPAAYWTTIGRPSSAESIMPLMRGTLFRARRTRVSKFSASIG